MRVVQYNNVCCEEAVAVHPTTYWDLSFILAGMQDYNTKVFVEPSKIQLVKM